MLMILKKERKKIEDQGNFYFFFGGGEIFWEGDSFSSVSEVFILFYFYSILVCRI